MEKCGSLLKSESEDARSQIVKSEKVDANKSKYLS